MLPFKKNFDASVSGIKDIYLDLNLQEAIYIASPALYYQLHLFLHDALPARDIPRLCLTLAKYYLRASSRSTPFGLFACVSTGTWADTENLTIQNPSLRKTRIDSDFVSEISELLINRENINSLIRFFPNNTIYEVGDRMRYVNNQQTESRREFYISDVDRTPYLEKLLEAGKGGLTKDELVNLLTTGEEEKNEASEFVNGLIQAGIFIHELDWRITGKDYFSHIMDVLDRHQVQPDHLGEIEEIIRSLDEHNFVENLPRYQQLANRLNEFAGHNKDRTFIQVDSYRKEVFTLRTNVARTIEWTIDLLSQLPNGQESRMTDFKAKFFAKYENRVVDLCTALDPEVGINYSTQAGLTMDDSNLLKQLSFKELQHINYEYPSEFQDFLIRKYSETLSNGSQQLVLREEELVPFLRPTELARSLYAFVSISGKSDDDTGHTARTIDFKGAYGPSAITLIARFAHLDPVIKEMISESTTHEHEQEPDAIFAEIVHVNQRKISNVSTRPVLRDYEIPVMVRPGVDDDHVILLNDLTITMVGNKLELRSKRLNREVIPRLSSAHNYSHDSITVYKFLCDLQFQNIRRSVSWDWGVLKVAQFLPRVILGNVILSPAQWKLSDQEIVSIKESSDLVKTVQQLKSKYHLPDIILVGSGDNKIPICLTEPGQLPILKNIIEPGGMLEESLLSNPCCLRDELKGPYANELIIPLTNSLPVTTRRSGVTEIDVDVPRQFALGSEWLYYKIYCNEKASNRIIVEFIKPLTDHLLEEGVIEKWFFIRYNDPENHIRLRFLGKGNFYSKIIERVEQRAQSFLDVGLISHIITDNYKREIERYGVTNIIFSEELFFIDSATIVRLVEIIGEEKDLFWQTGLLLADQLLNLFKFSTLEKYEVMNEFRLEFLKEVEADDMLKQSLSDTRRNNKSVIEKILTRGLSEELMEVIQKRGSQMDSVVGKLLENLSIRKEIEKKTLVKSHVHMTLNRVFESSPRNHEMILYDFLSQFYRSLLAKSRQSDHP